VEQYYKHSVNSDISVSTFTTDSQHCQNVPSVVSDIYPSNGTIMRKVSDCWEKTTSNQSDFSLTPVTSFLTFDSSYQSTDNTEDTIYSNYLPEGPDVPLSEVFSETYKVLGLNKSNFNSTGESF